jgi:hypothetical protein
MFYSDIHVLPDLKYRIMLILKIFKLVKYEILHRFKIRSSLHLRQILFMEADETIPL